MPTDLPQKIAHLCKLIPIATDVFVKEISKSKDNFQKLDPRTAEECLHPTESNKVSPATISKLTRFFSARLKIPLDGLRCSFPDSTIDDFREAVTELQHAESRSLSISFSGKLGEIDHDDIKYFCGKYKLYRSSFSATDEAVTEVAAISKSANANTHLLVQLYGHPSVKSGLDVEEFSGVIYKFGHMYSAVLSYGVNNERRSRFLFFPELAAKLNLHYGIVTAYSNYHGEPVSARVIVEKISDDDVLTDADKKIVKRGNPQNPNGPTIPEELRPLIENHIRREGETVLLVRKDRVPRRWPPE